MLEVLKGLKGLKGLKEIGDTEMNIIVSRHKGLIEWLNREGIYGVVYSHISNPSVLFGAHVYGVLPLSLACLCDVVTEVALPGLKPDQRGKELTPEEMDAAGAHLVSYVVVKQPVLQ